ncbi:MAG: glutathione S-transferase family protein [Burkholderiales bacterium]|nr:glutathione S-transferase family protein [Burkholderiales bacterium]
MSTPMIKLIGTPASRAMRNIWMLTELKLSFESDPIVTSDPALKQPPYTEWNPNAKIPICVVDGFAVYESLAINLYLDMKFPSAISLNSIEEKAQGMQWAMWALTEVELHSFNWYLNTIGKPDAERDAVVATLSWEELQRPLGVLEKTLIGRAYILGGNFTVVDLNTASVMYRALGMPLENFPGVRRWLDRCWAREGGMAARRARGESI